MSNVGRFLILALLFGGACLAQPPVRGAVIHFVATNPSGSCGNSYITVNTQNGNIFDCVAGTWTVLPGAGGGSGTVTSVTCGTFGASWLTCSFGSNTSTAPVLALSATTGQTSHQVIGTCGTATTFAPCALVPGDLPTATSAALGILRPDNSTITISGGVISSVSSGGTVTSVGFTGGIVSVATATSTPAFTVAGTSGGVPYFSSGAAWASSGALGSGQFVLGGGAGSAPTAANISGDCTTSGSAAITCLKSNGTSFGTAAFDNTGTSGATIPLLNGNLTFSGSNAYGTPASINLTNGTAYPKATSSTFGIVEPDNSTITISGGVISSVGSGSSAFSALTSSTNTTAAMVVGTGASLGVSGTGSISATTLSGGTTNDLPYQAGSGTTGFISPVDSAVLVTNSSGVPSESTTLPSGLALQTPASLNCTNCTSYPKATTSAFGIVEGDGSTLTLTSGVASCTTATTSQIGCVKPDGSSITISGGVISATTGGSGTVTVVGSGSLTSTAIVTGGGSQTVQTPSATSTLSSAGNMSLAGTITATALNAGSTAYPGTPGSNGMWGCLEGTAPTAAANWDIAYCDSTAHWIEWSMNNGSFLFMPLLNGTLTAGGLSYNDGTATKELDSSANWTISSHTLTGGSSAVLSLAAAPATTGLLIPKAAGAVPTADGQLAENTTNHTFVWGSNTTTMVGAIAATGTGTATTCTNQVVTAVSSLAVPTCAAVALASMVSGNLPVGNLNSGTSASSSTFWRGDGTWATPSGAGTVTSFSAGNLSPLFTTSVATSTSTPALTFSLSNAGAGTVYGNSSSSSGPPAFIATPQLGASGTLGSLTMGNATSGLLTLEPATGALGTVTVSIPGATDTLANLAGTQTFTNKSIAGSEINSGTIAGTYMAAVNLASSSNGGVTGNLPVGNLNSGTSASSSTFWRGDGTWATPSGAGTVTSVGFTGGLISVATATSTPALTVAGTSGGVVGFTSASTWASSAAWAAGGIGYGLGAGSVPVATAAGTAGQVVLSGGTGAPTMIDYPDTKVYPAANCVSSTGGAAWDTTLTAACVGESVNVGGWLPFALNSVAQFKVHLPKDWDGAEPYINLVFDTASNSTGTMIFQVQTGCIKNDGSTSDNPTLSSAQVFSTATSAAANRIWSENLQFNAVTSGNSCVANGTMIVKITRNTDTAAAVVGVTEADITIGRLLVLQAN